jgi:hypothetical protein
MFLVTNIYLILNILYNTTLICYRFPRTLFPHLTSTQCGTRPSPQIHPQSSTSPSPTRRQEQTETTPFGGPHLKTDVYWIILMYTVRL